MRTAVPPVDHRGLLPLCPTDLAQVHVAYGQCSRGWDYTDPQEGMLSLEMFARMLWRSESAQFLLWPGVGPEYPAALVRLVDLDFRHRSARFECWHLAAVVDLPRTVWAVGEVLEHAFAVLGLYRVTFLVPEFLMSTVMPEVAAKFEDEGILYDHLVRFGRRWDVHCFSLVNGSADGLPSS